MMFQIKNTIFVGCFLFVPCLNAQNLTIDECYRLANENYPLVKQYELIEKTKEFSIANAQKARLPQLGIYGQATYQSKVTEIPLDFETLQPILGNNLPIIPTIDKDQYKLYGELSYSLAELTTNRNQTDLIKAKAEIETQKIEVDLYKLRECINSLFFGILLIDAQIAQTEIVKSDIQNGIDRTEVAIANGVLLKSTADNLRAELLKIKQRVIELQATSKIYAEMLSIFIEQKVDENTVFEKPLAPTYSKSGEQINRPEMRLFELQNQMFSLKTIR